MIAATYKDLVMGLCTHFELVPMPAPTPTPIPHPFISMLSDPAKAQVSGMVAPMKAASGEVSDDDRPFAVNGIMSAPTGVVGKNSTVLPHMPLPPGTGWAPMPKSPKPVVGVMETPPPPDLPTAPAGDAVLTKGSSKAQFGKGKPARLGDSCQHCSEPARQQSTVLAVPKGKPVLING